jgi:hypothetical protein
VDLSDPKAMEVVYSKLMKPLQFDSFSMKRSGAYVHHYSAQLKNTQAPKEKILRLAQEQGTGKEEENKSRRAKTEEEVKREKRT